jgi:dTDP-4-dehydrorhamnose 3,5-epimerase
MPDTPMPEQTLLTKTIAAGKRDAQTVAADGTSVSKLLHGVSFYPSVRHTDQRGTVREMYDPRWGWHADPVEFVYSFTVRPGVVKGWGLHQRHDDRYFLLKGEMQLVMYDVRPDSPTCGEVSSIILSEDRPGIINIPAFVWHADYNFANSDALVVNFPTILYDHTAPDKMRLPVDTDLIPYKFPVSRGG